MIKDSQPEGSITFLDIYPVGAIYISTASVDPGTVFGGSWTQLKQQFLVGADDTVTGLNGGDEGGEATHTLSEAEMPTHGHTITINDKIAFNTATDGTVSISSSGAHNHAVNYSNSVAAGSLARPYPSGQDLDGTWASDSIVIASSGSAHTHTVPNHAHEVPQHGHTGSSNDKGSSTAHNNIPPYLAVYMWERTA